LEAFSLSLEICLLSSPKAKEREFSVLSTMAEARCIFDGREPMLGHGKSVGNGPNRLQVNTQGGTGNGDH
jgi:hypothetical protein